MKDYPRVNHSIGGGQDMSVAQDIPYKDWSVLFKPQNLVFFILPLEHAFAFKWWFIGYLLIVSCYYFCLAVLPNRRLYATLISISLFFAPFIQWWYQTATLAPIYYSFFIILLVLEILKPNLSLKKNIVLHAGLVYVLVAFALVLYPPFQIPCALAVIAFLLGKVLENDHDLSLLQISKRAGSVALSSILAGAVLLVFLKTRWSAVEALQNTSYPGRRTIRSGGYGIRNFFASQLQFRLQSDMHASKYFANQSEASNFFSLSPFLAIGALFTAIYKYATSRKVYWSLVLTNGLLLLLLFRLFVPHFNSLFRLIGLGQVPLARDLIGIGLLTFMQIVLLIKLKPQSKYTNSVALGAATVTLLITFTAGAKVISAYPEFINSKRTVLVMSVWLATIVFLVLMRRARYVTAGLGLFLGLSLFSTVNINPLYKGLSPITGSTIGRAVRETSNTRDVWAVADSRLLVNLPLMEGRRALTGIYSYPQPEEWRDLGQQAAPENTYNRYAHVLVGLDPTTKSSSTRLELKAEDYFTINTGACSKFLRQKHVTRILTVAPIGQQGCANLLRIVNYPNLKYYIYEITNDVR
jgi:hypothetical protein